MHKGVWYDESLYFKYQSLVVVVNYRRKVEIFVDLKQKRG